MVAVMAMVMAMVVVAEAVKAVESFGAMEEPGLVQLPCYCKEDEGRNPTGYHIDGVMCANIHS